MLSFSIRPDLFHGAPSCLIETLVVRPQARGSGVGNALMAECLAIARKAGCAEASVSTMQDNLKAIEFYKSTVLRMAHCFWKSIFNTKNIYNENCLYMRSNFINVRH